MTAKTVASTLAIVAVLATAPTLNAQVRGSSPPGPPAHEPLNPAIVARSGLLHQPIETRAEGWRVASSVEYGSAVERNLHWPDFYLYDAELLRVQVAVRRDVGARGWVRLQAGATGAYDGFADAFFEEYHRIIRWTMPERDTRPHNRYEDRLLVSRHEVERRGESHALLPSDVRATFGVRGGSNHQTVASLTLPLSPARSAFARRVPSVSVVHTMRRPGERFTIEGSLGVGYTARTGELASVQRTLLTMASIGTGMALTRTHSLYATLFHHGAAYRETGFDELDAAEYSADFGYAWRSSSGRVWRVGLTEDLRRRDPGIDLVVKVSVE